MGALMIDSADEITNLNEMEMKMDDEDFEFPEGGEPYWKCSECGHESHTRKMPADRAKFYARPEPGIQCPKCRSPASFVPVGW